jgi:hypothetical protein
VNRWFADYIRRGGRVHRDGVSPRLMAQLRREAHARARRQRALEAGHRHRWAVRSVMFLAVVVFAWLLLRHAWEL